MKQYLALLRGVNVGGKGVVSMAMLKVALEECGFHDVRTYIQSGNVFFSSPTTDQLELAQVIERCLARQFHVSSRVAVFTQNQWKKTVTMAPVWWGKDTEWKHNLLVILPPYDAKQVVAAIGRLKPDVEAMAPGEGVLYQSMSKAFVGRTITGSKLASNPIYKALTIRNYNTATKLLDLF